MRKLYDIDTDILSCFDNETGEILDEEKLNQLEIERDQKIEGVGLAIKDLSRFINDCKEEKKAIDEKIKQAEKQVDGYKHWLLSATEGQKFISPKVSVSFRSSESVEIPDESLVPTEYLRWTNKSEPDKNAIKQAIKVGIEVEGCRLVQKQNIQVK